MKSINSRVFLTGPIAGLALLLALQTSSVLGAEPTNLVANGDFSLSANGRPSDWALEGNASVTQTLSVTTSSGERCAEMNCSRFEGMGGSAHAMLAQHGKVHLVSGRTYEFSCQMRSEGMVGHSVSVAIADTKTWAKCGLETEYHVGRTWKTCRTIFRASRDVGPTSRLQIWFAETGKLYLANVRIVEHAPEQAELTDVIEASEGKNLVPNGSFELGASGWSSLGKGTGGWGNLDKLYGQIEKGGAPDGDCFVRISVGDDRTTVLYADWYNSAVDREISPLVANRRWIKVTPGESYTLSCSMRASKDGTPGVLGVTMRGAAMRAAMGRSSDRREPVQLTTAWKRYSVTFKAQEAYLFVFAGPNLKQEERVDVDVDAIQLERGNAATDFQPRRPVELALEPSEDGGIFYDDQPATLNLGVRNTGTTPCHLNVKFQATDFDDRPAAVPDCAVDVPAGTTLQQKVTLPGDWRGFYHVTASAQSGGAALGAQVRLAIVPRRTSQDSVCGVNHAFGAARLIDLASKAGVSWYRDWTLRWQSLEPEKGEYHFEVGDAQIDRVLKLGHPVLPLLTPFPSANWSSEAPASVVAAGPYPAARVREAWAPKDPADLAAFIGKSVNHYKDRIHLWEYLNEPIYTDYSIPDRPTLKGGPSYKPSNYVALLATASTAMRQADPTCKIMGGIAGTPYKLTQEVLDLGILKYIDYFNLHIYPNWRDPEAYAPEMDNLLKRMDAHGGRKPIWITEFSYYGVDNPPVRRAIERGGEGSVTQTERQCADFTSRFFAVMLSHGVQKIFVHSGASGSVNSGSRECAFFDYGGAPRKLFASMAVLTEAVGPAPVCAGTKNIGATGHVAAFETGKQAVLLLWQAEDEDPVNVRLPSGNGLTWMDAMGRKSNTPPAKLSSSMAYLVGSSGSAAKMLDQIAQ